jgi:N-acetylglucosamine kinase-like BadF-type ATPase
MANRQGNVKLVIGVDGGNTKTLAAACDLNGEVRGVGRGGCSNWEGSGADGAAQVITEAAQEALEMSGASMGDVVGAHMGLAGVDWPDDPDRMRGPLEKAGWGCPLALENDAFLPLRASAPEGHGIAASAGTGICCGIIHPDGDQFFYGAFTDLGGGTDINPKTIQAVLREEDGRGEPTALTPALLEATGHSSVTELAYDIHRRGNWVPKTVTDPVLFTCAAEGDPVAVGIVTDFGRELALCVANLIRRYELAQEAPAVVAGGSLFMRTGPLLFRVFREDVVKIAPRARLMVADHPGVMGAVRAALAAAGQGGSDVWERARHTATQGEWFGQNVGEDSEEVTDEQ